MKEKKVVLGIRRYSEELKLQVCQEYLDKNLTVTEIAKKYRLSTHTIIYDWLRKYEYLPPRNGYSRNIVEIGLENFSQPLKKNTDTENSSIELNKTELERLKKELEDARILSEGYKRMIEIAEQEYKISIRKKLNTK